MSSAPRPRPVHAVLTRHDGAQAVVPLPPGATRRAAPEGRAGAPAPGRLPPPVRDPTPDALTPAQPTATGASGIAPWSVTALALVLYAVAAVLPAITLNGSSVPGFECLLGVLLPLSWFTMPLVALPGLAANLLLWAALSAWIQRRPATTCWTSALGGTAALCCLLMAHLGPVRRSLSAADGWHLEFLTGLGPGAVCWLLAFGLLFACTVRPAVPTAAARS